MGLVYCRFCVYFDGCFWGLIRLGAGGKLLLLDEDRVQLIHILNGSLREIQNLPLRFLCVLCRRYNTHVKYGDLTESLYGGSYWRSNRLIHQHAVGARKWIRILEDQGINIGEIRNKAGDGYMLWVDNLDHLQIVVDFLEELGY
jgi:hypothetical protein